jgi:hypothetical protein
MKPVICILLLLSLTYASAAISAVVQMNATTFDVAVKNSKVLLVMFIKPACILSMSMAPIWEQLALNNACTGGVVIAEMDCSQNVNHNLCESTLQNGKCSSYPVIYFQKQGKDKARVSCESPWPLDSLDDEVRRMLKKKG